MAAIPPELGSKVSTRTITWEDLVVKAWGSEFRAPDHGIYRFSNGQLKDSTDKYKTGIYGVVGDQLLLADGTDYPDMRDGFIAAVGQAASGVARNGLGNYEEILLDPTGANSANGLGISGGNPPLPHVCLYGPVWSSRVAPATYEWSSIAYSDTVPGLVVAIGRAIPLGSVNVAMYSLDYGNSWQPTVANLGFTGGGAPFAGSLICGSGLFVYSPAAGVVYQSSDGHTWSLVSPAVGKWYSVRYGNGIFVAGSAQYHYLEVSADGTNWGNVNLAYGSDNIVAVCHGTGGKWMLCGSYSGGGTVYLSTDNCATLTLKTNTIGQIYPDAIAYNNGVWVVGINFGPCQIQYSTDDGTTWTSVSLETGGTTDQIGAIQFAEGVFLATDAGGQKVATSLDGITWNKLLPNVMPSTGADYWKWATDGNGHYAGVATIASNVTAYGTC